jgi:hypothetical protein
METIKITVSGEATLETVSDILTRENSGFEMDLSNPPVLNSGMELGITIAGLVLNAAQFAAAIWQIRQSGGKNVSIEKEEGSSKEISGETPEEIEEELNK